MGKEYRRLWLLEMGRYLVTMRKKKESQSFIDILLDVLEWIGIILQWIGDS